MAIKALAIKWFLYFVISSLSLENILAYLILRSKIGNWEWELACNKRAISSSVSKFTGIFNK